jgi:ABC-2 type transport system permease protein
MKLEVGDMKLKRLFCSKAIIKNDLKMVGFLGVLYTIFLALIIPVDKLFEIKNDLFRRTETYVDLDFSQDIFIILSLTVPVLMAIILFRYIQEIRAVSKIHSLPYTRNQIFNSHIISGMIIIMAPVIINCGILGIGLLVSGYADYIPIMLVFKLLWRFIIVELVIFLATIMVGMMVGSTILNVIVTYILLVLPFGIAQLINVIFQRLLFGYPYYGDVGDIWYKLSPFFASEMLDDSQDAISIVIIFLIYSITFYFVARYLYNQRDLERNNEMICFDWGKYIFIYGVTFCSMLVAGVVFGVDYKDFYISFLIGCIIGALIGYSIATAIAYKTLRIYQYYKGYVGFIVVAIVLFCLVSFDAFGYERIIPEVDEVEFVSFYYDGGYNSNHLESIIDRAMVANESLDIRYTYSGYNTYEEEENIEKIVAMHHAIYNAKDDGGTGAYVDIMLVYQLKNGKTVFRKYSTTSDIIYNEMKAIYEGDEFAYKNNDIFRNKEEDIISIELDNVLNDINITIADPEIITQLTRLVKEDILDLTYEEHLNQDGIFRIIFNYKSEVEETDNTYETKEEEYRFASYSYTLKYSYEKTIEYLKSLGYYEKLRLNSDEVESILLFNSVSYHSNYIFDEKDLGGELIEIEDETDINRLLEVVNYEQYWGFNINYAYSEEGGLDVEIHLKNGDDIEGYIPTDNIYKGLETYINEYK